MSWAVGYDEKWQRDIGYGVPAACDHPGCETSIDRGLGYVCGGEPFGGEHGCGLFFCAEHLWFRMSAPMLQRCERCSNGQPPFDPTPDTAEWLEWKLTDESWAAWRAEHPELVDLARAALAGPGQ